MKLKLLVATLSATVPLAALANPAQALTFFNARTAWTAAAGANPIVEEDFSTSVGNSSTIQFGDGFVTSTGQNGIFRNAIAGGRYQGVLENSAPFINPFDSIVWSFAEPVIGLFANWGTGINITLPFIGTFGADVDPGLTLTIDYIDASLTDDVLDLRSLIGGGTGIGEWGFLTGDKFSSVTFAYNGTGVSYFTADDLAVAVPTPALLPGLIGMGAAALRKRRKEAAAVQEV